MANSDKNIVITPYRNDSTYDPKIVFSGANASVGAQTITARIYPANSGTLSFEGSAGQLLSLTNTMSGTIFSVNDVSGIPSIEVMDTGDIRLARYGGSVYIGTPTSGAFDGAGPGLGITSTSPAIYLSKTSATARDWLMYVTSSGSFSIWDGTANLDRLTIDTAGKIYPYNSAGGYLIGDGSGGQWTGAYFFVNQTLYVASGIVARGGISNDGGDVSVNDNLYVSTYFGVGTTPNSTYPVDISAQKIRIYNGAGSGYAYVQLGAHSTATNNWHFGSEGNGDFRIYNGNWGSGTQRLNLTSGGTLSVGGSLFYDDGSNTIHQYDNSDYMQYSRSSNKYEWKIGYGTYLGLDSSGLWSSSSIFVNNGIFYVGYNSAGSPTQTSSTIWMGDSDNTSRAIHCNSNRIGFLNSSSAWSLWSENDGSVGVKGRVKITALSSGDSSSVIEFINNDSETGYIYYDTSQSFVVQSGTSYMYFLVNGTQWYNSSDERQKTIIEPITNAAAKVSKLRSVIGTYNADSSKTRHPFLIAQDVLEVLPEAVDIKTDPNKYGMCYTDVIPLLVAAIKELSAEIDSIKSKIN